MFLLFLVNLLPAFVAHCLRLAVNLPGCVSGLGNIVLGTEKSIIWKSASCLQPKHNMKKSQISPHFPPTNIVLPSWTDVLLRTLIIFLWIFLKAHLFSNMPGSGYRRYFWSCACVCKTSSRSNIYFSPGGRLKPG